MRRPFKRKQEVKKDDYVPPVVIEEPVTVPIEVVEPIEEEKPLFVDGEQNDDEERPQRRNRRRKVEPLDITEDA